MPNNQAQIVSRTATSVTVNIYSNHNTGPENEDAPFTLMVSGQLFPGAAPPYTTGAVVLNGSTGLWRNGFLTGLADNPRGVMSVWIQETGVSLSYLMGHQGLSNPLFNMGLTGAPQKVSYLSVATGSAPTLQKTTTAGTFTGSWRNIIISWDVGFTGGSRKITMAIQDINQTLITVADFGVAYTIQYGLMTSWGVGALANPSGLQNFFTGYMADFQFYTGMYLDLSAEDNRRLFIDADGKPVDPTVPAGVLGTPVLLFSGNAASFATNQGSGGAFTTVGSLSNAPTSPSD